MKEIKFLYHGSRFLSEILKPILATGIGSSKDSLCAIYASQDRNFAIPFALPIMAGENKSCIWELSFENGNPKIIIKTGKLDTSQVGYLYKVPADTFEQIDEFQWVSFKTVKLIEYEIINPKKYLHWIEKYEQKINGNR
ncbi:MAG: hypothetical protein KAW87_06600 [Candidatus Cloacimonetes bacterium]|nr:hypothetical protein [Candidatus Cloacimonadota bacterium]